MRKRFLYAAFSLFLLLTEAAIALFVHDRFVRPYLGDVLVTVLLCCALRILFPNGHPFLPLWVFLFAAAVEVFQGLGLVSLLGLDAYPFFRILLGSVFDVSDLICYGAGCLAFAAADYFLL